MGRFVKHTPDYNLMAPEDMDEFLFEPFELALGEETVERLRTQFNNYEYYDGKQHLNDNGELVFAEEMESKKAELGYEPTRYATNYFKKIINEKARWQMSGKHSVHVPRPQIDPREDTIQPGYEPSSQQQAATELAEGHEKLLNQLWKENKMRSKLISAARDRLLADRVVCKIVFNPQTGKLKWAFRPDTEFFPVYSDDDYEEMIACHFIRQKIVDDGDDEILALQKQTFTLEGPEDGTPDQMMCYIEEGVYNAEDLELIEQITPKTPMELNFIPVVAFTVNDLLAEPDGDSEVADMRRQNDILNQLNEDAIDAMKFEMFAPIVISNGPDGISQQIQVAPNGVIELPSTGDGSAASVKRLESGFKWKEAYKETYMRVKGAMHEISGLPHLVPQEMNFGGLNTDTLQIIFHDIIADTEEHWLAWEEGFNELHEKSIKYLQARLSEPAMQYDKDIIRKIENYETEMRFVLPLPDNRAELVDQLANEMSNRLESQKGAMERLGVEDVKQKQLEIQLEQQAMMMAQDPFGGAGAVMPAGGGAPGEPGGVTVDSGGQLKDESGEPVEVCPVCGGSGTIMSKEGPKICDNCRGDGFVQARKR